MSFPHIDWLPGEWDRVKVGRILEAYARRVDTQIEAAALSGEANVLLNLGTGTVLGAGKDGLSLLLKSLVAGSNVAFVDDGLTITISATVPGGAGEANTSSNLGAGQGLATAKVGVDLPFKSLVGGAGILLTATANEITIAVTALTSDNITNASTVIGTTVSDALETLECLAAYGA